MNQDELRKTISDYIKSHRLCTIALSRDNKPSAHTVYYVSDGLDIFFESDPVTDKVKTIEVNPRVALTIDDESSDWRKIKGIQLQGRAEIIPQEREKPLIYAYLKKYPSVKKLGGIAPHHVFVKIIPEKIYYLDYEKEFGYRAIYHVEEKGSTIKWG